MKNFESLAKLEKKRKIIKEGVEFYSETVLLDGDRFTNLYWIKLDKELFNFDLSFSSHPRPLKEFTKDKANVVAGINFGGLLLVDENTVPIISNYNLSLDHGCILQFPSNSRSAIHTNSGKLERLFIPAHGIVSIGNHQYSWSGSQEISTSSELKVFGIFDLNILINTKKEFGHRREIEATTRHIQAGKDEVLLGVLDNNGIPQIATMNKETLDLMEYLYVFKCRDALATRMKIGDAITNLEIGNEKFGGNDSICSASFTLGKDEDELKRNLFTELLFDKDSAPKPLLEEYKKSWSIVLDTGKDYVFFINDTRPKIPSQQGVTISELQEILNERFVFEWAVVGDSGQSSKLMVVENGERKVYGNLHYMNYKSDKAYWDGENGRLITVALLAYD